MRIRFPAFPAAIAAALLGFGVSAVPAAETRPFDAQSFAAAQKAGKPILVDVTAPWCPTCRVQKAVLARLTGKEKFADLVIFETSFDTQKDALRRFRAGQQSTLIVFKGTQEMGRSVGETGEGAIETLLEKAL